MRTRPLPRLCPSDHSGAARHARAKIAAVAATGLLVGLTAAAPPVSAARRNPARSSVARTTRARVVRTTMRPPANARVAPNAAGASNTAPNAGRNPAAAPTAPVGGVAVEPLFDGRTVANAVDAIAHDDVVLYGTVARGGVPIQGQLWLVVGRRNSQVYYHLSEVHEPAGSNASFGGYRVLVKSQITNTFFNFGAGRRARLVGNATDAFLVLEMRTWANSTLGSSTGAAPAPASVPSVPPVSSPLTNAIVRTSFSGAVRTVPRSAPATAATVPPNRQPVASRLVEKGTFVETFTFPRSGTGSVSYRTFDKNGRALSRLTTVPNPTVTPNGSPDCAAVGENTAWVTGLVTSGTAAIGGAAVTITGGFLSAITMEAPPVAGGIAAVTGSLAAAAGALAWSGQAVAAPLFGSIAEATCNYLNPPASTIPTLPNVPVPSVVVLAPAMGQAELVCDDGVVINGSHATDEADGSITITGTSTFHCTHYTLIIV